MAGVERLFLGWMVGRDGPGSAAMADDGFGWVGRFRVVIRVWRGCSPATGAVYGPFQLVPAAQLVAGATTHPVRVVCRPSTASRARLTAAASRLKSASTLLRPLTRARRPPCLRRIR